MKKLLAIFIAAVIILGAVEVVRKPSAQQIVNDFDSIVHVISLTQITRDSKQGYLYRQLFLLLHFGERT